jgi:hypothetical protein
LKIDTPRTEWAPALFGLAILLVAAGAGIAQLAAQNAKEVTASRQQPAMERLTVPASAPADSIRPPETPA